MHTDIRGQSNSNKAGARWPHAPGLKNLPKFTRVGGMLGKQEWKWELKLAKFFVIHRVDFASSLVRFTELYMPTYAIVAKFFLLRRILSNKCLRKQLID